MSAAMEIIYCLLSNKMKYIRELFPAISLQSLFFLRKKVKDFQCYRGWDLDLSRIFVHYNTNSEAMK
jgi:hypothetical protein